MPTACRLSASIVAVFVLTGCSGNVSTYPVKGKVKFPDGTPVSGGRVTFQSTDKTAGVSSTGTIGADGSYVLGTYEEDDGAVPGPNQVVVGGSSSPIDPKFGQFGTSGLEFTVAEDDNTFDITVDKPPPPPEPTKKAKPKRRY